MAAGLCGWFVFVEVFVCKDQSGSVPILERRTGQEHCKVTGDCRQGNVVVKGNKNKAIIGSFCLHSPGEGEPGPVELSGGLVHIRSLPKTG